MKGLYEAHPWPALQEGTYLQQALMQGLSIYTISMIPFRWNFHSIADIHIASKAYALKAFLNVRLSCCIAKVCHSSRQPLAFALLPSFANNH